MKKTLLLPVLLLMFFCPKAQFEKGQVYSGSSIGVMFDKVFERRTGMPTQNLYVTATPDFGFCISEHFTMGLRLNFNYRQHKELTRHYYNGFSYDEDYRFTEYSIGPGVSLRYFKIFKSKFGFFVQMNFDARVIRRIESDIVPNFADTTEYSRGWAMGFAFTPGIVYFPKPLVAIYATYGSFGYAYSTVWQKNSPNLPERKHELVFQYMPSSLRLGVDFYFRKKKKKTEDHLMEPKGF
jgi:hypothetical protein